MKLFVSILISLLFISPPLKKSKNLNWADLIPEGLAFNDPFVKLTESQLYDVAKVARLKALIAKSSNSTNNELKTQKDSIKAYLLKQGIDADTLISQREYVKEMRTKNANAVVKELNNAKVKLAGYLLPLNLSEESSTEFLLVPWVGACIHTPPPPTNQIVHIYNAQGYDANDRFKAVVVEGLIYTEKSSAELYLIDGSDIIHTSYTMKETTITAYKAK